MGCIYRHPCMEQVTFIDDYLQPLNDKLINENKKIFLTGDFNFYLLKSDKDKTLNFFETMMSCHLLPTITLPTKINDKRSTTIDNSFTNQIRPDMKSGNISINISDHLPSFFIIPTDNQNHLPNKQNLYTRKTKNFDRINFLLDYLDIDWNRILEVNQNDANISMQIFLTKINSLLDKYMPLRKITKKEYKRRFKPWIKDQLFEKIEKKNKAFKICINCKNPYAKEQLKNSYKTLKNDITALTRQNKKEYYNQYFTENTNNLQKIWKGIKEIINIKSKNYCTPTCIIENNRTITDPREMTNSFNTYYTSVAEDILQKRNEGVNLHTDLKNTVCNTFAIYECDRTEVENIISSLNPRKATGPNSIPTDILHLKKDKLTIFNISMNTGVYPDLLKLYKTTPVYKKGLKVDLSNYRPISLLSNLNKILEKLMFNRLYKYLEDQNCIYNLQFGFRKKHSTSHALTAITESI